jgi:hypothetical protein
MDLLFPETSYQTARLADYSPAFRDRAAALFRLVAERVGSGRAKQHIGSYSVLAAASDATAAKILIYESGKGKMNGDDPHLADGVYVLVRVHGAIGRPLVNSTTLRGYYSFRRFRRYQRGMG